MALAVTVAVVKGAAIVGRAMLAARGATAADKATVLAQGIGEATNCAFFTVVLVPAALVIVFLRRKLRAARPSA